MRYYYVYLLKTTSCNKFYIGITTDPRRRYRQHMAVASKPWKTLTCCGRAVKRYGPETFTMVIKGAFDTMKQAAEHETIWIKRLGKKRLWNSSRGGEGHYGKARRGD